MKRGVGVGAVEAILLKQYLLDEDGCLIHEDCRILKIDCQGVTVEKDSKPSLHISIGFAAFRATQAETIPFHCAAIPVLLVCIHAADDGREATV